METVFYILDANNQQAGPYSEETILQMLQSGQITYKTPIWKQGLQSWVNVGDLAEFSQRQPVTAPAIPQPPKAPPLPQETKWFLYVQDQPRGPHSQKDIEAFLHKQQIRRSTHAWKQGMTCWMELFQIPEFKSYFTETGPASSLPSSPVLPKAPTPLKKLDKKAGKTKWKPILWGIACILVLFLIGGVYVFLSGKKPSESKDNDTTAQTITFPKNDLAGYFSKIQSSAESKGIPCKYKQKERSHELCCGKVVREVKRPPSMPAHVDFTEINICEVMLSSTESVFGIVLREGNDSVNKEMFITTMSLISNDLPWDTIYQKQVVPILYKASSEKPIFKNFYPNAVYMGIDSGKDPKNPNKKLVSTWLVFR